MRHHAAQLLDLALTGDVSAIKTLGALSDQELTDAANTRDLMLSRIAVIRVLSDLAGGVVADESAQRWAAFMRWGNVSATRRTDLDIEWEPDFELAIAEALGRLDELGDLIDGTIDADEISQLIKALSEPSQ